MVHEHSLLQAFDLLLSYPHLKLKPGADEPRYFPTPSAPYASCVGHSRRTTMSRIQLGFSLVAALVLLSSPICLAQEHTFEGKFISIQKKSNPANSVDLEKVEVKTLGGRAFLVG